MCRCLANSSQRVDCIGTSSIVLYADVPDNVWCCNVYVSWGEIRKERGKPKTVESDCEQQRRYHEKKRRKVQRQQGKLPGESSCRTTTRTIADGSGEQSKWRNWAYGLNGLVNWCIWTVKKIKAKRPIFENQSLIVGEDCMRKCNHNNYYFVVQWRNHGSLWYWLGWNVAVCGEIWNLKRSCTTVELWNAAGEHATYGAAENLSFISDWRSLVPSTRVPGREQFSQTTIFGLLHSN